MQRIIIKPFGPIQDIEIPVNDILLFIGPQATGKSTISKGIFFFKSLKDELMSYFIDCIERNRFDKTLGTFAKRIKNRFLDFWGSSYYTKDIHLRYDYGNDVCITVDLKSNYVNPEFNDRFKKKFSFIVNQAKAYASKASGRNHRFLSGSEMIAIESEKKAFFQNMERQINDLFNDDRDLIFIPAGRSLSATLSAQLQSIESRKLDYLNRSFIQRINNSKPLFHKSFDALITDRKKLTQEKIEFDYLRLAQDLINDILKATYRFDDEGEKLYYDSANYTKLNFSSSGQQESIWILLLIFLLILENRKVFIVFEEPEAHLFPEAQQAMVHLIALLSNVLENQVVITTHSPYILSSYNNLLYAHRIGKIKPEETNRFIDRRFWISPRRVGAYYISEGSATDILDQDTLLIKSETIDSASERINKIFDRLLEMDVE